MVGETLPERLMACLWVVEPGHGWFNWWFMTVFYPTLDFIPVGRHKAVAEVSKQETYVLYDVFCLFLIG